MYTHRNFQTKKALKEAVKNGEKIGIYQPGGIFNPEPPSEGQHVVEGPHYPQPHKWYAQVTLKDGFVVAVK